MGTMRIVDFLKIELENTKEVRIANAIYSNLWKIYCMHNSESDKEEIKKEIYDMISTQK